MAIGYGRLTPVRKAGSTIGRAAHHGGHRLSHGASGRSAYIAAERHISMDGDFVTDYTKKHGVEYSELVLPGGGTCDREQFWNAVDAHKTQSPNATVGRDLIIAFPHEFSFEERKTVAKELATWISERYQVAVDFGMHLPETHKGSSEKNYHGHYLISERMVSSTGELGKIQRDLNQMHCRQIDTSRGRLERKPTAGKEIRLAWERIANAALERGGYEERIDMRSWRDRGIDKKSTHLGASETRRRREAEHNHTVFRERLLVKDVKRDLSTKAHEQCEIRMASLQRIAEIQENRKEQKSTPNVTADIGPLAAWQRDALGMLVRYWQAETRAAEIRRRLRYNARQHLIMREATKEEERTLRSETRKLRRAQKLIRMAEETLGRLAKMPDTDRIKIEIPSTRITKRGLKSMNRILDRMEISLER